MSERNYNFVIRCRAIIFHNGKLLVVSHPHDPSYYALPGGHLEWGEGVHECLRREIIEELGVEPKIGRLLYVNTFADRGQVQPFEFFFEVLNGADYLNLDGLERTHMNEIYDLRWVGPGEGLKLLPKQIDIDLQSGQLLSDTPRFIKG